MLGRETDKRYTDSELLWVFNRSDGVCVYCGSDISFHAYLAFGQRGSWVVDRFIPLEKGGTDQIFNWVAACPACSYHKGWRLPWEFDPDRFPAGETKPEVALIHHRLDRARPAAAE